MNNYTAETIESLDYFEHIRRYPGMYIGSKDLAGLHHCVKEIISNSIDEWLNGTGDEILVRIQKDGGIFISDHGRGIPHGTHSSGCSVLQACYGIQQTGGKFNNATGESGYNTSGGEHGTGGKAVNALSTKMIVTTAREGIKETVEFSKGTFINYKSETSKEQGVTVLFYPDAEIFDTIEFDSEKLEHMIQEFSYLCKGLNFVFIDEKKNYNKNYYSENGLYDYLEYLNNGKEMLCSPFYFEEQDIPFQVEVAFGYNTSYNSNIKLYTNNIPQEKGTHLTGFKTAFTSTLNTFAKEKKWIKDNLTGSDLEEGQLLIINFKMIDPVFKGQNKEELSSSEGRTYTQKLSTIALKSLFETREKDIKLIVEKAVAAKKAREAAKKAKENARGIKKEKNKILNLPTKLVDAWSKDRSSCELLICEGDSAASGLIGARTGETQAIFPIRGKLINLFKAGDEKVFANQEVVNIIKALGLELDPKQKKLIFDKQKLRYGKIILCCDGDPDGQAIKNLLLTYFWSLCPELILQGYLYVAVPPLFRITTKKNEYIYLKDTAALEEYKSQHKNEKYLVNRNKGLGEQSEEELAECLLEEQTRNILHITVEDANKAGSLFDIFMGPTVPRRRQYILEHSEEANI